jgi:hypothetical protein
MIQLQATRQKVRLSSSNIQGNNMNIYNNIAMRSLNQVKTLNPILYLCIRCFYEDFSESSARNNLFDELIKRKLEVRKHWATQKNKLYKEKSENNFIYRDILSLSPFGMIAESYLMRLISQNKFIENKKFIYSYLLPENTKSNRNFQYYFNGYKRRNEDVYKALLNNKNSIALVLDLSKFYPSIEIETVKNKFITKLEENTESQLFKLASNITNSLLEQSSKGVPIGTELSHLMAQIYLEDFDTKLSKRYSEKYFRYVDDIIIICNVTEKDDVIEYVKASLPSELNINTEKTDQLTLDEWKLLHTNNDLEEGNLFEVLNFITAYVSMHPTKIDSLEQDIKSLGYNIPLSRIKHQAKSKGFMSYIKSLIKNEKRYSTFEIYFTKNEYIVKQLINLQKFYLIEFNKLLKSNYDNSSSAENRANTQKLKFVTNRLLYLSTLEDLERIGKALPETEKFEDTKEVINALVFKDLTNSIQYGGKVIQTICELWIENNFETIEFTNKDLTNIKNLDDVIDSLIVLFLYKVVTFNVAELLTLLSNYNQEYVQVVLCDDYIVKNKEYEFLLELQGLLQGRDLITKYDLLTTRYDNDETIQLAGLNLGLSYSL